MITSEFLKAALDGLDMEYLTISAGGLVVPFGERNAAWSLSVEAAVNGNVLEVRGHLEIH